jgi:hypothetical protein
MNDSQSPPSTAPTPMTPITPPKGIKRPGLAHLRRAIVEIGGAAKEITEPKHRELLLVAIKAFESIVLDSLRAKAPPERNPSDEQANPTSA